MSRNKKKIWIVGTCEPKEGDVRLSRVYGDEDDVKKYLADEVEKDRIRFNATFEGGYGTASEDEVLDKPDGSLFAFAVYPFATLAYSAVPEMDPIPLDKSDKTTNVNDCKLYMAKIGGWNPVVAFADDEETAKKKAVAEKKKWFHDDLKKWTWETCAEFYGAKVELVTHGTVLVD